MAGLILTLNAGSSSLKFAAFTPGGGAVLRGQVAPLEGETRLTSGDTDEAWPHGVESEGLHELLGWIDAHDQGGEVGAVGHRIVHGGDRAGPARVDEALLAELAALTPLAPLHQPHNLAAIRAVAEARPAMAQVACFDTSFHATMGPLARALPLPEEFTRAGARRYGFHGLSYQFIAGRLRAVAPGLAAGRVIVAHLGSGASLCAMRDGRSVDTTMGMTALDGVMMGTRPGRLDPGVVLWLLQARGMDAGAVEDLLYHHAGLLGVSGESPDPRKLLASGSAAARFALDLFVHGVVREAGALAAMLGGVDGFVFAGGIGEHQAELRAPIAAGLAWLGPKLDPARNDAYRPEQGPAAIGDALWVIPTDEEAQIAALTEGLL
jgi:acetate kinase